MAQNTEQQTAHLHAWVDQYRKDITADPLKDFSALDSRLDLTKAHPSGTAQLFATGQAHLSSLYREASLLTAAERDLGKVVALKASAEAAYGFGALSLVAGVATWADGVFQMPVLLYPLEVDRAEGEKMSHATLRLVGRVSVNPDLVQALKNRGVSFDPQALLTASEYEDGVVNAAIAMAKISALASRAIEGFDLEHLFVVGCFVNPVTMIARQADATLERIEAGPTGMPLLDALAGSEQALSGLAAHALPTNPSDDADPHDELEVGDVPNPVRAAARAAAKGASLYLDAPSNATSAGYALAIATRAAAAGKTVLYAPCVGAQKEAFLEQATKLGVEGLVLDATDPAAAHSIDTRLIAAIGTPTHDATVRYNQLSDELVGIRARLSRYFGDLHQEMSPWGVSAYETIENLAQVSALPSKPRTRVRLTADAARLLKGKLSEWGEKLLDAGKLGEFALDASDTAWYKAALYTPAEAQTAYSRVVRLLDRLLPAVREQIRVTVETCGFPVPDTVSEWGTQVTVLQNLRRVLDVFTPAVFERDLTAMLSATLTKQERKAAGVEMGLWERRRNVKEAKSLLRPGTKVENLHEALTVVARQSQQWRELVPRGGWPVLPPKLDEIVETFESLTADLTALDVALSTTPEGGDLTATGFVALESRLQRLFADKESLETLPARASLEREFDQSGLSELVDDLHARAVSPQAAVDELQLSWWTTVFEIIVHSSDMIANQDGGLLTATTERFTHLDLEHISSIGSFLDQELGRRLSEILYSRSQDANQLHSVLAAENPPAISTLLADYPTLMTAAKPILVATPANLAASFSGSDLADLVIVDSCAHAPAAEVLAVLSYAPQAVVIAHAETASSPIVTRLHEVLPVVESTNRRAPLNLQLADFLRRHGGSARTLPVSARFHSDITVQWVDAQGLPMRGSGLVETTSEEIDAVVAVVEAKAHERPHLDDDYALTVVTLTPTHGSLVLDELVYRAQKNKELAHLMPRVHVGDLSNSAGMRPGDVIVSTSFGKTTHGKLLQQFGNLEALGGDKRLLDVLSLVTGDLDVIAGFTPEDLEDNRLSKPGPKLLKEFLTWASGLGASVEEPTSHDEEASILLTDLARRLRARGLSAELGYGLDSQSQLPLVVGAVNGDGPRLAVFTDDERFMSIPSLRLRHRFMPRELKRAGWSTLHVWSVGAFVNPDREVERIIETVEAE